LVRARAMYQALSLFLVYAGPAMVAIVSFASFTERNDLPDGWVFNTARAFTSITLFNILRWPLVELPQALNQFVAAKLSIARLEDIFNRPSMDANVSAPMITKKKPMVQMQHCTFAWPEHQDTNFEKELKEAKAKKEQDLLETVPQSKSSKTIAKVALQIKTESSHEESPHAARAVLHEVNLQINHGALVCVIGDTGSGKSSLLNAILGELPPQTSQNWKKPPISSRKVILVTLLNKHGSSMPPFAQIFVLGKTTTRKIIKKLSVSAAWTRIWHCSLTAT